MSIETSPSVEARLLTTAQAEGLSIDVFLERLINERVELTATLKRIEADLVALSPGKLQEKIERGFLQSERGKVEDGDAFTAGLLHEITEMERKRRAGLEWTKHL